MDLSSKLLFPLFLVLAIAADGIKGYATVSGTVFCDQCKYGERSLFDYPVSGIRVTITCSDGMSREETTNWFGGYVIKFDGTPDLTGCSARVSDSTPGQTTTGGCNIPAGPSQRVRLMFSLFGWETYAVDSLLAQPAQPMSTCPKPVNPVLPPGPTVPDTSPSPVPVAPANPSPVPVAPEKPPPVPVTPEIPPPVPVTPKIPPPVFSLPPMRPLPPFPPLRPMLPMPLLETSACSHQYWLRPEFKCYWKTLNPDTKVAVVFGLLAGRKYGTDITLRQALYGRGEAYKTLLREATTALLNSYNSLQFPFNPVSVVTHTNLGLMGSERAALMTALRFIRANSGSGNEDCKLKPCQ